MSLLKALLYGFISAITEILPVSSSGHQAVFRKVLGDSVQFDMYNLFVHMGILVALLYSCKSLLHRLRRSRRNAASNDQRVVKNATPSFIIVSVLLVLFYSVKPDLLLVAALFVLNGIILFIPGCIASGNKDARSMTALDSTLIGISGGLSAFPGLSRIAFMTTLVSARGGDRRYGVVWALALSVPAMVILIFSDLYLAIVNGIPFQFTQFFCYLMAFAGSFCGCCISVKGLRRLTKTLGLSVLSYYCWGMAILSFILYLMV